MVHRGKKQRNSKMTTANFQIATARRLLTQLMPQALGADTTDYKQQMTAAQSLSVGLPDQTAVTAALVEQQKNAARHILLVWPGDPQIAMIAAQTDDNSECIGMRDSSCSENQYLNQRN